MTVTFNNKYGRVYSKTGMYPFKHFTQKKKEEEAACISQNNIILKKTI